jgi:hypothetical protein
MSHAFLCIQELNGGESAGGRAGVQKTIQLSPTFRALESKWARYLRLYSADASIAEHVEQELIEPCREKLQDGPDALMEENSGLLVCQANEDGASKKAVERCARALGANPRHWQAATQRVVHMINANKRDRAPQYPKAEVKAAIKEALGGPLPEPRNSHRKEPKEEIQ